MNEPACSGDGSMQERRAQLMNDGRMAILAAGATQPINSPQVQEDEGTYFSDFYAFHPYEGYAGPINGSDVNALNTETLERGFSSPRNNPDCFHSEPVVTFTRHGGLWKIAQGRTLSALG
jgi:hypothetical protein